MVSPVVALGYALFGVVCLTLAYTAQPASVPIPAALLKAPAGGAGARVCAGIRVSQPDRKT